LAAGSDENIRGLNAAVDDAFLMRRIQPVSNLNTQVEQSAARQGRAMRPLTRPDNVGTPSP
jgi:hypothetical protein